MTCLKCKSTGLLPLKNKQGQIIPFAWTFCECHQDDPSVYDSSPADFDFAMSYDCWRALCRQHGWHEPEPNDPEPITQPLASERVRFIRQFIKRDDQMRLDRLEKRLNAHLDKTLPKRPSQVKDSKKFTL